MFPHVFADGYLGGMDRFGSCTRLALEFALRCCWEVLLDDLLATLANGSSNHLLRLSSVVASVLFHGRGSARCVLTCKVADLTGLWIGDVRGIFEVVIDQLLVRNVNERTEVENAGRDEAKTPERGKADQEVGNKGGEKCLHRKLVNE